LNLEFGENYMFKATVKGLTRRQPLLPVRALYAAIAMAMFAPSAYALIDPPGSGVPDATVTAVPGLPCPPNGGAALQCTANDFIASATSTSPTQTPCNEGDPIPNPADPLDTGLDLLLHIAASNSTRNDVGFFADEVGVSPNTPGSVGIVPNAGTCSVATFPLVDADPNNQGSPAGGTIKGGGWFDENGPTANKCGDHEANGATDSVIQGIHAICKRDATHHLTVPFMLTYAPNNNGACTSANNVGAGTGSKCSVINATVSNVVVLENADPACDSKVVTFQPFPTDTITSVITLSNHPGLNSGVAGDADGTTFSDVVPAPATAIVGTPTCVGSGGATCTLDAANGLTVSGTISPFPTGSSVTLTIVASYPDGDTSTFINSATVTPLAGALQAGSDNVENNTCPGNQVALPVKLQNFDVK
jgi:hypothetical protein